ncbi:lipopolysaccharide assembly protein LapA domain-containing protein [Aurantiacibacter suaedae]|uniref:lipopolysaccharide assembly protein LapA domain-containing protein n=1 Tax=Aurantiacibacter suaedae TaxID=2545755 RepID=UPI0010F6D474|nr:LapA family protein [Aurantiacibacter suaedae]
MQILRTFAWALLLAGLVAFSVANWTDVTVRIWPGILVDTKVPAIVIISFLIGFVPMWLYLRASKWQARRRIQSLENATRVAQATPVQAEPAAAHAVDATPVAPEEAHVPAAPPIGADPMSPIPAPSSSKPENP